MTIVEQIDRDLTEALKAREAERLGALRMVKTALKLRETEVPGSLGDEEALRVLNTLIKQRRDAAEQFRAAGREDLAQKEEREAKVIQGYLPTAASSEEMVRVVEEAVAETGATSPKDMGAVMKAARARLPGQDRRRKGPLRPREGAPRVVTRSPPGRRPVPRTSPQPYLASLTRGTPAASVDGFTGFQVCPIGGQEGRRCETAATPSL